MKKKELSEKICFCIDTSTKTASVAIGKSEGGKKTQILCSTLINDGLTHSEKLVPLIDHCLNSCGLDVKDIDLFGCVNGPGSFTGLRIGISTINALSQSYDKKIIGVDTLEAIAFNFRHFEGYIIPMIDARRDNVFAAVFESGDAFKRKKEDDVINVDELLSQISSYKGRMIFAGDGLHKSEQRIKDSFGSRAIIADGIKNYVSASIGVELVFRDYFSDNSNACKVLMPNYVRGTSAKTIEERSAQNEK